MVAVWPNTVLQPHVHDRLEGTHFVMPSPGTVNGFDPALVVDFVLCNLYLSTAQNLEMRIR